MLHVHECELCGGYGVCACVCVYVGPVRTSVCVCAYIAVFACVLVRCTTNRRRADEQLAQKSISHLYHRNYTIQCEGSRNYEQFCRCIESHFCWYFLSFALCCYWLSTAPNVSTIEQIDTANELRECVCSIANTVTMTIETSRIPKLRRLVLSLNLCLLLLHRTHAYSIRC